MDKLKLKDIKRAYAAASVPNDLESFKNTTETRVLTFEMFVQIQFQSVELADNAFDQISDRFQEPSIFKPRLINGKKMFAIVTGDNKQIPKNLLIHRYAPDTIEFGTEGYLASNNRKLLSQNLVGMWSKMPTGMLRIAFDMDAARPVIEEDRRSKPTPVFPHPGMLLVDGASVIGVHFDSRDEESRVNMTITARDEKRRDQIDDIVSAMGKQYVKRAEENMNPGIKKAGLAKVPTVQTRTIDRDVIVSITTPNHWLNVVRGAFGASTATKALPFDPQSWRDAKGDGSRLDMVESLSATLRVGMTADEVTELLGEPIVNKEGRMIYGLGKGLIDYEEFWIIFDDDGKVESFHWAEG